MKSRISTAPYDVQLTQLLGLGMGVWGPDKWGRSSCGHVPPPDMHARSTDKSAGLFPLQGGLLGVASGAYSVEDLLGASARRV